MRHKWDAHANLQRLYQERIGNSMTQKEFGRQLGISQSMVAQILSGDRTLPLDLAPKFATALRCSIYDICPEMGDYIKEELLPVLGKALRRAAMFAAVFTLGAHPSQSTAHASSVFASFEPVVYYVKSLLQCIIRHSAIGLLALRFLMCQGFASTISAWLMRFTRLSGRALPELQSLLTGASACSSPTSLPTWPMSTLISLRPFATH